MNRLFLILSAAMLCTAGTSQAADRYFVTNGSCNGNWTDTDCWSTTSGGAGGSSAATSADAVFFDANSPSCTADTSARTAGSLNFTGYTNTLTMNQQITVSGSVTLVAAMTIAGSSALLVSATATLTSNGKTWPNALTLSATATYTLADNWTVGGLLSFGNTTTAAPVVNSFKFIPLAGVRFLGTTGNATGTTELSLTVTQTLDAPSLTTGRGVQLPITIQGGAITVSGLFPIDLSTLKYLSGTVVTNAMWTTGGGQRGFTWVQ